MFKIIKIFLFYITFFWPFLLWPQKLEVAVSSRQVQPGQMLEIRFTANGSIGSFTPPSFRDFEVVGGPNQSSSIQVINGNFSQSQSISYYLVPRREGKFTIGSASAIVDGQKVSSVPVVIEVMGGGNPPSGTSAAQNQQNQENEGDPSAVVPSGKECFIRTSLSKTKCMKGEFVIISQKIYSKHPIVSIEKFDPPSYEGVWSQTLQTTSGNQLQTEVLNGVTFYSFEIYRHQISPTQAGKLKFKAVDGVIVIRRAYQGKPRNIWEQFFGAQGYQDVRVSVRSQPVELIVSDLPQAGRPENFSGAIGDFVIKSEISAKEIRQNEALNLKVVISGRGNIQTVEAPRPELPDGFEFYDPKITESGNSKSFDYLIIPRNEGNYTITLPPFSFFSTEKKQYITLPPSEFFVKVLPGNGNSGPQVYQSQTMQQEIPRTEQDIRYIRKFPFELSRQRSSFTGSMGYWLIWSFPWLVLTTLLAVAYSRKKQMLNPGEYMFRRASREAYRYLEKAGKEKNSEKSESFYFYITRSMQHYLCAKLKIGLSDFRGEVVYEKLLQHGVSESTAVRWTDLYARAEQARYAPGFAGAGKDEFLTNVRDVLNQTEKEFK